MAVFGFIGGTPDRARHFFNDQPRVALFPEHRSRPRRYIGPGLKLESEKPMPDFL